MRLPHLLPFLAVAGIVVQACGDTVANYPPLENCSTGPCKSSGAGLGSGAGAGPGTGGGTTTTTTGSGGEVAIGTLTGSVQKVLDPAFLTTSGVVLSSLASIIIQPATGPQITAGYGGASGTTFTASNIPSGPAWVEVQDQSNGGASIWNTISSVTMPQLSPVTLPVIDQGTFTNIASNLPNVQAHGGASMVAAQVVLILTFNGAPYKGLQVMGTPGGATVAYDIGPGNYSDSATATGTAGTIILFDAGLSGPATINLYDPTLVKTYPVTVQTAAAAVTLAAFDL